MPSTHAFPFAGVPVPAAGSAAHSAIFVDVGPVVAAIADRHALGLRFAPLNLEGHMDKGKRQAQGPGEFTHVHGVVSSGVKLLH
jgi:hypothetical protein